MATSKEHKGQAEVYLECAKGFTPRGDNEKWWGAITNALVHALLANVPDELELSPAPTSVGMFEDPDLDLFDDDRP